MSPPCTRGGDAWPAELTPEMADVVAAVSCTMPRIEGAEELREVEALYLDMISPARRYIYIENQYFTSQKLGAALVARLAEPDPPEIVVVTRLLSHGWLEEHTMEALRTRLVRELRAADHHKRFEIYHPRVPGLAEGTCVDVHSKVAVVDDEWLRIGSANFANRSMGLDSECDVTFEAGEEQTETSEVVMSLASAADPEHAVSLDQLIDQFSSEPAGSQRAGPAWGKIVAAIVALTLLAGAWRYTPLSEFVTAERATSWAKAVGGTVWAPFAVASAYSPAAFVMFPRPLITLFAVVAFGPWLGLAISLTGIAGAATCVYYAGRAVPRDTVRRIAGKRLNRVSELLRRQGVTAAFACSIAPVAPFVVVGMVAGAVRMKLWQYLAGTLVGMLPGTILTTVFGKELAAALEDPGSIDYWVVAGIVAVFAILLVGAKRWMTSLETQSSTRPGAANSPAAQAG